MKYVKQFGVILLVSFLGELAKSVLPFPVPASIYGLVFMLIGLGTHLIPLNSVKDTGYLLVEWMPLMFIPAGVELLESWGSLQAILFPVSVITVTTTIIVMAVSGKTTQMLIGKKEEQGGKADE